jgi:hypothetical protein
MISKLPLKMNKFAMHNSWFMNWVYTASLFLDKNDTGHMNFPAAELARPLLAARSCRSRFHNGRDEVTTLIVCVLCSGYAIVRMWAVPTLWRNITVSVFSSPRKNQLACSSEMPETNYGATWRHTQKSIIHVSTVVENPKPYAKLDPMFSVGKYKVTQENLRCAAVSSF